MKMVLIEKSQEREDENLEISGLGGSKVDLNGALAQATNWEEMARVEYGRGGGTVEKKNKFTIAKEAGVKVADLLIGVTTRSNQLEIIRLIKSITEETVASFLRGYHNNQKGGDDFFIQLATEYDFPEKRNLMKNIALKLAKYGENRGSKESANSIRDTLKRSYWNVKSKAELLTLDMSNLLNMGINRDCSLEGTVDDFFP